MDWDVTLERVVAVLERLDATANEYDGLVPAVLDVNTGRMPTASPQQIPGQRSSELADGGANLLDDAALLSTTRELAANGVSVPDLVGPYVSTFATECADTATGLFPWGDHAYWDLDAWQPGSCYDDGRLIHDQRLRCPTWLWEAIEAQDSRVVQAFADGLDWHWIDEDRSIANRHAYIDRRERRPARGERSCDFPRHIGTFLHDVAIAHRHDPMTARRQQLHHWLEYWSGAHDDRGLLPYERRGHADPSPQQTLAYASGLSAAATVLDGHEPDLVATLDSHIERCVTGFLTAGHDGGRLWAAGYPNEILAAQGLTCLHVYRRTHDERLLEWAIGVGNLYRGLPFPGTQTMIPAKDPGLVLELYADLAAITGDQPWIEAAQPLVAAVLEEYLDRRVPRAATGIEHYDAHHGTGTLLHGLARIATGAKIAPWYGRLTPGYRRTEAYPFGHASISRT